MTDDHQEDPATAHPEDALVQRFELQAAPTMHAHVAPAAPPIAFSRLRHERPQPGRSIAPPLEEAFVFQVPLSACRDPDIRYSNQRIDCSKAGSPGGCYLLDLSAGPTRRLDRPFDNMRLYLRQSTIDALNDQHGRRITKGLTQSSFGARDPILFHLAQTMVPILETPESATSLFVDHLALALCEHIIARYSNTGPSQRRRRSGLASWQRQRIVEYVDAHLGSNLSIIDLAAQCDLSASHFADAFKQTTGASPHQWLLKRRIERACEMLCDTDASLAAIAIDCGFFDQSHFSRVFARFEGCGPRDWRRHNRRRSSKAPLSPK